MSDSRVEPLGPATWDAFERLVEEDRAHAALVLDGDEAIAWAQFGPPQELPNIHHRKEYLVEGPEPDYRATRTTRPTGRRCPSSTTARARCTSVRASSTSARRASGTA